jgi:hypothetical protein
MQRRPDLDGQSVPTWEQVQASGYVVWDDARDGPRIVVDMTDANEGYRIAMRHLSN